MKKNKINLYIIPPLFFFINKSKKVRESDEKATAVKPINNDCSNNDVQKSVEEKPRMPEFYSLNDIKEKFGDNVKNISKDLFEKDSTILEAEDELQLYKKRIIKDDQDNNEKIKKIFLEGPCLYLYYLSYFHSQQQFYRNFRFLFFGLPNF